MSDIARYSEMFDYLSDPVPPTEAAGVFVFGRYDTRLVKAMGELMSDKLADYFLITGGLGKDSGYLWDLNMPEANYLASVAASQDYNIPSDKIYRETKALNGGENARYGLAVIQENELTVEGLIVVAHATSLRRLSATLDHEARRTSLDLGELKRKPTDYPFDPQNPKDQEEAKAELLRLADWPAKGWVAEQPDLPENLVDFARDTKTPKNTPA